MKRYSTVLSCSFVFFLVWTGAGFAIELDLSRKRIDQALERGFQSSRDRLPPDQLYAWFGSFNDLEPRGFIMTRLIGLRVLASHFALRGELPTEKEIQRVLTEEVAIISVIIFGETPTFAKDSYLVLKQETRLVKPVNVRFDAVGRRSKVWPDYPRYQAKVVGSFRYDSFNPVAPTTILVFPGQGGEVSFEVDFSSIP